MIRITFLYMGFTVLLAMIEALRTYIAYGKKENIDHTISTVLGVAAWIWTMVIIMLVWPGDFPQPFSWLSHCIFIVFSAATCVLVRLSEFNILLNFYRIITGTNPTGRLDYVSTKTSSKTDTNKWWSRLSFWQQRGIATAAWAFVVFTYYKLHQFNIFGL